MIIAMIIIITVIKIMLIFSRKTSVITIVRKIHHAIKKSFHYHDKIIAITI